MNDKERIEKLERQLQDVTVQLNNLSSLYHSYDTPSIKIHKKEQQFDSRVGFYGTTPVSKQELAYIGSMGNVGDTSTSDQSGVINTNFSNIKTAIEDLEDLIQAYGLAT